MTAGERRQSVNHAIEIRAGQISRQRQRQQCEPRQGAHRRQVAQVDGKRAVTDAITILFVIFYIGVLLWGGISSTNYAIVYGQKNYTAWGPPLWPIKVVMTAAIFMMLLQCISAFFKDVAIARGKPIA